eukprot:gb/GEZN01008346.1/.p1 GENE.gb/GEZN01008346.1/~~gb/GEZN01008346.1/.p1  ORF type:complete len:363 (-),score=49.85 gb/GEZN01008346.1/:224-1312(-)
MAEVGQLAKQFVAAIAGAQQDIAAREVAIVAKEEECRDKCAKLLEEAETRAAQIVEKAEEEREEWKQEKKRIAAIHQFEKENPKVVLDVGGQTFATHLSVLRSSLAETTLLGALFSGRHPLEGKNEPVFIDRDHFVFRYILNFLRDPARCRFPRDKTEQEELFQEAQYYCLPHEFFCSCDPVDPCNSEEIKTKGEKPFSSWKTDNIIISGASHTPANGATLRLVDDSLPSVLAFDNRTSGSIEFRVPVSFYGVEMYNGDGMSFDVELQEKNSNVWVTVVAITLSGDRWNSISWEDRPCKPQSWRLSLTNNTAKKYLQGFRWLVADSSRQLPSSLRPWCVDENLPHLQIPPKPKNLQGQKKEK